MNQFDAADAVLAELNGRAGFDHWWDSLDTDIQEEIRESIAQAIGQTE